MWTMILKLLLYLPNLALAVFVQHAMWHGSAYWGILGIPGLLVSFLIGGPHGGDHLETQVASALSVLANSASYFFVCWWFIKRRNSRLLSRKLQS
jgi:hypothetical protein